MSNIIRKIPVDVASFTSRANRIQYLLERFGQYLCGSVLDVGCDKGLLRNKLDKASSYTGVDIGGEPDIQLDLQKIEKLPFDDGSFDVVVCTDVLEHLDNIHFIIQELARVSKRYLVISLPNNWSTARRAIQRGDGNIGHYGLPVHPPADRHRWFFNLSDAENFLTGQADLLSLSAIEMRVTQKPRLAVLRFVLRLLAGSKERYLNKYSHTLWVVFEKPQGKFSCSEGKTE